MNNLTDEEILNNTLVCSYCGSTLCAHIIQIKIEAQRRHEVNAPARPSAADGRT